MQQIDPTTGLPIAQTPSNQMGAAKPLFNPSTMINAQNIYGSNQDRSMSLLLLLICSTCPGEPGEEEG